MSWLSGEISWSGWIAGVLGYKLEVTVRPWIPSVGRKSRRKSRRKIAKKMKLYEFLSPAAWPWLGPAGTGRGGLVESVGSEETSPARVDGGYGGFSSSSSLFSPSSSQQWSRARLWPPGLASAVVLLLGFAPPDLGYKYPPASLDLGLQRRWRLPSAASLATPARGFGGSPTFKKLRGMGGCIYRGGWLGGGVREMFISKLR